ncbi:hypothetical protein BDF22DRAFT_658051 [Syncephalis plumigaleata]|nr:hypothetical protein BDF22DRAFT_658051 [Syncephalis plumigaleata]
MSANLFIGDHPIDTYAQRYVMEHQKELGLSNIRWGGGNAFRALKEAKRLTDLNTMGRHNVMDPLHQFGFYEENGVSYIDGVLLSKYFKEHSISEAYTLTASILPEVIKGLIYLYNAGIIHGDMFPKRIFVNPNKTKNPFSPAYVLTEQTILSYFMRLKQSQTYIKPEQVYDNENVMTLAQHDHTTTAIAV